MFVSCLSEQTPRNQFRLELIDPSGTFQVSPTDSEARASVTLSVVDASNIDYDTPPSSYNLTVSKYFLIYVFA